MQAFALTDKGMVRTNNQDYIFSLPCRIGVLPNLFIVADGMGGHLGGDFASRYTVERLTELIKTAEVKNSILETLDSCIQTVNRELYEKSCSDENLYGMGTTLVLCYICDGVIHIANVGDSRLYIENSEGIKQITHDHSLVEELVAHGSMEKNSPEYFQKKNVITRAVGVSDAVSVDYFEADCMEGDTVLLCSDGLTNMVSDEEIKEIIDSNSELKDCAECLVGRANRNGGADNISVVLVKGYLEADV